MFGRKDKTASAQIDNAVAKAVNYEVSIADIARRSEKRAWMIAFASILMSLILAGGYFFMLPLKEKVPYLVMADAYTGTATMATLRGDFNSTLSVAASEALGKSNVAHYIISRESFDAASIGATDWKRVHLMSSNDVGAGYSRIHDNTNPDAPFKTYGRERAVRVEILSIQLSRGGSQQAPRYLATVRFQRNIYDKKGGKTTLLDNKIATLEYKYNNDLKLEDAERVINPLGFQVVEYRVDNDYSGAAPVATPATAQALGQQQTAAPTPYGQAGYPAQPGYPAAAPGQAPAPGQPVAPGTQPYAVPTAPDFGQPPAGAPIQQPQNPPVPTGAPAAQAPPPTGQAPNQVNGVGN